MTTRGFAEKGGWWVAVQAVLFVAVFVVGSVAPSVDPPWPLAAVGWVVIGAGAWLGIDGLYRLRRHISPYPAPLEKAELVTAGAFSLVRHPIYGGLGLLIIGLGLTTGNIYLAVGGVGLSAFFAAKSAHEEQLLLKAMPEYADYRQRVNRRLMPWVW